MNDELTKTQIFQAACWATLAVLFLLAVVLLAMRATEPPEEYKDHVKPFVPSLPAPAEGALHDGPDSGSFGR